MEKIDTPTLSGVGVPSLVRFTTTHRVGAHCFILVSRSLVSTGCTCVVLVDPMTVGPAIVPQKRLVCQATFPSRQCCRRHCATFVQSQRIRKLLVGRREQGD